jgi:hypothetical protein
MPQVISKKYVCIFQVFFHYIQHFQNSLININIMTSFRTIALLALITTAFQTPAQEMIKCNDQRFNDPFMDKIAGTWSAGGKITGDSVIYHFNASWELNHQFMVLNIADTAANPQYTAKVFIGYDCISERYVCHWLDNFGGRFSETLGYGTLKRNILEFRFEYPDGPFINMFIYNEKRNTWQMHTTTKNREGNWVTFGDIYLKRIR